MGLTGNNRRITWSAPLALSLMALATGWVHADATRREAVQVGAARRVFVAAHGEILAAITNAFSSLRYHETMLIPARYDLPARRWASGNSTNEWMLYTGTSPLTTVRVGKEMVPYFAEFDLRANPLATNRWEITVRTTASWVHAGKEVGIHGGWAAHSKHIPPVLQEETNVLVRIERQLHSLQGGELSPLAPTPDARDASNYRMREVMELNPGARSNLPPLIEARTNNPPHASQPK